MAFTAENLLDRIDAEMATSIGAAYTGEVRSALKNGALKAIAAAVVACIKEEATVSFSATQITGVDAPQGNTHSALVASGGTIS